MEFVNGKDDIPYMKWKIKNVWNHQPDSPSSILRYDDIWWDIKKKTGHDVIDCGEYWEPTIWFLSVSQTGLTPQSMVI